MEPTAEKTNDNSHETLTDRADESRTAPFYELEDAACHADEAQSVAQAAADRLDDPHVRMLARSLDELNDRLNELAYE